MNDARTKPSSCAETVPGKSPHRYELIGKDGLLYGEFISAQAAAEHAKSKWPSQEQDEDRTGKGWDIQVAGAR